MKKTFVLFLSLALLLQLTACTDNSKTGKKENTKLNKAEIAPYELTEYDKELLGVFEAGQDRAVYSYFPPEGAKSFRITVYKLTGKNRWEITGNSINALSKDDLKQGLLTARFGDDGSFSIGTGGSGVGHLKTSSEKKEKKYASLVSASLQTAEPLVPNKEIPILIQGEFDEGNVSDIGLKDYKDPSNLKGYGRVQVITVTFLDTAGTDEPGDMKSSSKASEEKEESLSPVRMKTKHSLLFPASDLGKTEFNKAVYEIKPFLLSVSLPDGWSSEEQKKENSPSDLGLFGGSVFSFYNIYNQKKEFVGAVGYNTYNFEKEIAGFTDYDAERKRAMRNDPAIIYNKIGLGNGHHFDVRENFKKVNENKKGYTLITDVYYSASANNGKEKVNKGILCHNKNLSTYVAFEFDREKVTDDELKGIAESLSIGRK